MSDLSKSSIMNKIPESPWVAYANKFNNKIAPWRIFLMFHYSGKVGISESNISMKIMEKQMQKQ